MLLYRAWHGRAEQWKVPESSYDKLAGAFGGMPIVLHLGDLYQLKPTGTGMPLVSDLRAMEQAGELGDMPAEFQQAMRLFCATPLCLELLESNRFKDTKLRELMGFMRAAQSTMPASSWATIHVRPSDPRLAEERFQTGHMIAIY